MNRSYAPIPLLGIIGAVQVVLAIYCIRTGAIPHGRRPQTIRANNPRILAHHRSSMSALVSFGLAVLVGAEGGAVTK